jgi:hypothetical protein
MSGADTFRVQNEALRPRSSNVAHRAGTVRRALARASGNVRVAERVLTSMRVCLACGYLGKVRAGDPMRTTDDAFVGKCPACANDQWLDPGHEAHRDYLAELDERVRARRRPT